MRPYVKFCLCLVLLSIFVQNTEILSNFNNTPSPATYPITLPAITTNYQSNNVLSMTLWYFNILC